MGEADIVFSTTPWQRVRGIVMVLTKPYFKVDNTRKGMKR